MINQDTGRINFNNITDINIENERIFWYKFVLVAIITIPITCPLCHKGTINLQNNPTINNPIIGRCSWNHCRKIIYLREKTFLSYFPRTPASVIFKIINLWLVDKDNTSTITSKLNYQLNNYHITRQHVLEILNISRYYIATYLKHVYIIESISESNKNESFSIDESHFLNKNSDAIWVIGAINNSTKKFRLEISTIRNEAILKKFISLHIKPRKHNSQRWMEWS